jgi:DTW domain-containing protein YfiP
VIIHIKEMPLSSNTGRIATYCLQDAAFYIRGSVNEIDFEKTYIPSKNHTQLFLYPSENSIELSKEFIDGLDKPVELVVPDATWRQAKKFHKREPTLNQMQMVHINQKIISKYKLRAQKEDTGVCTLEAIAHALEIIEGNSKAKEHLLEVLEIMNYRTLSQRKKLTDKK